MAGEGQMLRGAGEATVGPRKGRFGPGAIGTVFGRGCPPSRQCGAMCLVPWPGEQGQERLQVWAQAGGPVRWARPAAGHLCSDGQLLPRLSPWGDLEQPAGAVPEVPLGGGVDRHRG